MDITNPAITAAFIALIYSLIRVIEYFVSKYKTDDNLEKLKVIEAIIKKNGQVVEKLYDLHAVFDNNHVPKWYVPAELLGTVRNMNTEMTILNKEIIDTLSNIKGGQTVLVDKLADLINSQRLMTERLGDLVAKLNKISD